MTDFVLRHEASVRLVFFLGIFVVVGLWEWAASRRSLTVSKSLRWINNIAIVALNTLVLRVGIPVLAVGMAHLAEERSWGLLNLYALPGWLALPLAVAALDLIIYLQHVMVHAVPALWKLHRMHHADLDIDLTTGARFHPLEILLSMGIKLAAIVVIGPAPAAVIVFEVLLNGAAMFNHGNIRLPIALDAWLRWLVVTPDMHRVHHSIHPRETNSNFGFNLPWWDRLFGTYIAQPRDGHEGMTIGLDMFRNPREQWLDRMLTQPFRGDDASYAINRRGGE